MRPTLLDVCPKWTPVHEIVLKTVPELVEIPLKILGAEQATEMVITDCNVPGISRHINHLGALLHYAVGHQREGEVCLDASLFVHTDQWQRFIIGLCNLLDHLDILRFTSVQLHQLLFHVLVQENWESEEMFVN